MISTAERLIDPCKVDPVGRAAVPSDRIRTVNAAELGPGPWGAVASPTRVGETRHVGTARLAIRNASAPLAGQIDANDW